MVKISAYANDRKYAHLSPSFSQMRLTPIFIRLLKGNIFYTFFRIRYQLKIFHGLSAVDCTYSSSTKG